MTSYCFGPFELDPQQRVLQREGELVPITPKAFDLLALLVENAGRVVAREEISQTVWHDVFIDESNITKNISHLRKLLRTHTGEDPIRTIPKRGYQFVLPVSFREDAPQVVEAPKTKDHLSASESANSELQGGPARLLQRGKPQGWWLTVLVVSLACLALAAFGTHRFLASRQDGDTGRRSVAILPFSNLSGNADAAWVGSALQSTLSSDLDAGGALRVVPGDAVDQMERDLHFQPSAILSGAVVQRIGTHLHCDYVIGGAYLQVGDTLRLDTFLQSTRSGKIVERFTETRSSHELLGLLSETGTNLLGALGARNPGGAELPVVVTSLAGNPAALRLYVEGLERLRMFDGPGALQTLQGALAHDPSLPLTHSALAETYELLGDDKNAAAQAKAALDNSATTSREQRLIIEAVYERFTRQWDAAVKTQSTLVHDFPDDLDAAVGLGQLQLLAGKPAEALHTIEQLERSPAGSDARVYTAEASVLYQMGQYVRMRSAALRAEQLAQAQEAHILFGRARTQEGDALVHIGDAAKARAAFEEARTVAESYGDKVGLMHALRREGGAVGLEDPRASLPLFQEDCETAQHVGDARENVNCQIATAFAYLRLGDSSHARPLFTQALQASETIHDKRLILVCLEALGRVEMRMAAWHDAEDFLKRAGALEDTMDSEPMKINLIGDQGMLLALRGDRSDARTHLEGALQLARKSGDVVGVASALANLAWFLDLSGDTTGAGQALQEECNIWAARHQQLGSSKCLTDRALHAYRTGNTEQAKDFLAQARYDASAVDPGFRAARLRALISLHEGSLGDARDAAQIAETLARSVPDELPIALESGILQAQVEAAAGQKNGAAQTLQSIELRARRAGLEEQATDARLALQVLSHRGV